MDYNKVRKMKRCPQPECEGLMDHRDDHSECIKCGFFLSNDCCRGEEISTKQVMKQRK